MRAKRTGSISPKGYIRVLAFDPARGRKRVRMMHNVVWEQAYGPIPVGFDIHHIDRNKQNNDLTNLQLVPHEHHLKIERGFYLRDGKWFRPCIGCEKEVPGNSQKGRCKPCRNRRQAEYMYRTGRRSAA